jgi:predicted FMN-binding regulatory protein PaiB
MDAPTPIVIVTKAGLFRNHAAQRQDLIQAHLKDIVKREIIIFELHERLHQSDGKTAADRSVVADMQSQLRKLAEELANCSPPRAPFQSRL